MSIYLLSRTGLRRSIITSKSILSRNVQNERNMIRLFSSNSDVKKDKPASKGGIIERLFGYDSNEASKDFKGRWLMVIPAFATHMSIGSPWAWSIMADSITREVGFVASAAADWTLFEAAFPLSIVFLLQGLSASVVGKWQLRVGPRKAMAAAALAFGGGLMIGSAGIYFHSLPLLYAGYGFLGGTGIGLAYTPPVQTLMQWFPDKKGIASGLTIAGFGSGALFFTPAAQYLMRKFAKLPEYLGPQSQFTTTAIDGKMFADVNGKLVEVVSAGATELSKLSTSGLSEGLYIVGTGSTGASEALAVLGVAYLGVILASALTMKKPHSTYVPEGYVVPTSTTTGSNALVADVSLEDAMKKPQFYLLGTTFFCLATGGMGMFSVAKPMMNEVFSSVLPAIVTSAFASQFLLMLSAGNLGGRLAWAAVSDMIGRRKTFYIFTLGSVPLYLALPTIVSNVISTGSVIPLYGYIAFTATAVSMMGGVFAILPAYEADLFGTKNVGPIHGRMLVFSSMAAIAGPYILLKLRSISEKAAIHDLLSKISPEKFEAVFGATVDKANELLTAKTLSISKLLVLAPPGTIDPTPHLYDTTMYTMGGLMVTAVIAHGLVQPIKAVTTTAAAATTTTAASTDTTATKANATTVAKTTVAKTTVAKTTVASATTATKTNNTASATKTTNVTASAPKSTKKE